MPEPTSSTPLVEIGTTGLKRSSGFIHEEFLRELQGQRAIKVYREMASNDPIVGAILFALTTLIKRVTYIIEPADDSPEAEENAEFIDQALGDLNVPWSDVISEICTMFEFGFAPLELVYKKREGPDQPDPARRSKYTDGMYGWRKMALRAQETVYQWLFDDTGGIRGFIQLDTNVAKSVEIPIERILLFRTTIIKGNPEGRSILRNAYRPWYFKRHIEETEGIGIERDLAGLPVGWVPPEILAPTATPEQVASKNTMEQIIRNIRRDEQEGVIWPLAYDAQGNKLYDLTLLSTGGNRQFDTNAIIARYDARIAQTILADTILMGHEKVGSYALAESKNDLFTMAITSFVDGMCSVINRFAIPKLFKLNGNSTQLLPKMNHSEIEKVDFKLLTEAIKNLSGAGAVLFPDDELENHLRKLAKLPAKANTEI